MEKKIIILTKLAYEVVPTAWLYRLTGVVGDPLTVHAAVSWSQYLICAAQ